MQETQVHASGIQSGNGDGQHAVETSLQRVYGFRYSIETSLPQGTEYDSGFDFGNSMRIKIGRLAGIDVMLHWTYFLAPAYIVFRLKWERNESWSVIGILMILLVAISFCVLLHEFGHALMARRFGVGTKDIIITPIGGLARLERMPRKPVQELLITLAGPVVNLSIAIVFGTIVIVRGGPWIPHPDVADYLQFPAVMMWVNLALFLFNLIPAFPMDGGRIMRAGLALVMPYTQATLTAGRFGQVCATAFSVYGLLSEKYLLILIGAFVFFAARFEMNQARWIESLSDPANRDARGDDEDLVG